MHSENKVPILLAAAVLFAATAAAIDTAPMAFEPLAGSATRLTDDWEQPLIVPEGYVMHKVSDETDLNIYRIDTDGSDVDGIRWTPWGSILFTEEDPGGLWVAEDARGSNIRVAEKDLDGDGRPI
jgi:hypothetical protein